MQDTVFLLLLFDMLFLTVMFGVYFILASGAKVVCFEDVKRPHYTAFFLIELVLLVIFVFLFVGVIGYSWLKLAGPDNAPAWVTYLFQKI